MNNLFILTTLATLAIFGLVIFVTFTVLCVLLEWCETGVWPAKRHLVWRNKEEQVVETDVHLETMRAEMLGERA
jgi:hypothetical protein